MKIYALPRVDGGVVILRIYAPDATPDSELAKWHPSARAELTGAYREISEGDIPKDRSKRGGWKPDLSIDAAKVAAQLSEAERLVEAIKADPDALAALKEELGRAQG